VAHNNVKNAFRRVEWTAAFVSPSSRTLASRILSYVDHFFRYLLAVFGEGWIRGRS
jgi:hypothetical protein